MTQETVQKHEEWDDIFNDPEKCKDLKEQARISSKELQETLSKQVNGNVVLVNDE